MGQNQTQGSRGKEILAHDHFVGSNEMVKLREGGWFPLPLHGRSDRFDSDSRYMVSMSKLKISIALIAVLTCVNTAEASILVIQPDNSGSPPVTYNLNAGEIGQSVTYLPSIVGVAHSIILYGGSGSAPQYFEVNFWECATQKYSVTAVLAGCTKIFSSVDDTLSGSIGYFTRATTTSAMTFQLEKFYYLELQRSADNLPTYIYGTNASSSYTTYANDGASGLAIYATTTPYFQIQTEQFDQGTSTFTFGNVNDTTGYGVYSAFSQWNILQTKFPLNWIFESYTVFQSLSTATATVAVPDISITFTTSNLALLGYASPATSSRTQTFFASNTLANVASIPHWTDLRTLESYFLWIGLIFWVWARKHQLVKIHQS